MLVISRGADDATDLLFALQADGGAACPSVTSLSLPAKYIDTYMDSVTVLSDILAFFPRLGALDMTIDCGCPEFHVDGVRPASSAIRHSPRLRPNPGSGPNACTAWKLPVERLAAIVSVIG
jgi:hypothetical protein